LYLKSLILDFFLCKLRKMLKKQIKSAILLLSQEGRDIMTKVIVKNGNVEGALRVVKQKSAKDGSSKKLRERQEGYMKPGVKRRLAKKEAIKNSRRRQRENY